MGKRRRTQESAIAATHTSNHDSVDKVNYRRSSRFDEDMRYEHDVTDPYNDSQSDEQEEVQPSK